MSRGGSADRSLGCHLAGHHAVRAVLSLHQQLQARQAQAQLHLLSLLPPQCNLQNTRGLRENVAIY